MKWAAIKGNFVYDYHKKKLQTKKSSHLAMEKMIFGAIPNITLSYCWSKISHPRYFFATMKTMMIGEEGIGFILNDEKISSHG